jgi:RNA polymerase sigma-54 factor
MELSFGLLQQQQTRLVMTPELRQSITILQYSIADLMSFLREKASENPLLELIEPEQTYVPHESHQRRNQHFFTDEERGYDTYQYHEDYVNPIDYYVRKDLSLNTFLFEQVAYLKLSPQQKKVLLYLVGNLDENGYLDEGYHQLPEHLSFSAEALAEGVDILQQLEPIGVGARSLEECLLLQVRHATGSDPLCERVIQHHLADLAAKRYAKIAKALRVSEGEVQQVADFIRSLNPKPGRRFSSQELKMIVPDVLISRLQDQQFIVQANDLILPRIQFNTEYTSILQQQRAETKAYLHEKLQQYEWIKQSLEQRHRTIVKVTEAIIDKQLDFFCSGDLAKLKPLSLKDIAQEIDVHESTVSRATSQKYAQTPWGVYELKYFFSNKLPSLQGSEGTSTDSVKQMIKQIIGQENKAKPMSDQAIVKALYQNGVKIARRTVAKYREELGILSSAQRKEKS